MEDIIPNAVYFYIGEDSALETSITHGLDDTLAINNFNYRNVFSAYAIDHLTRQGAESDLPITVFNGASHPKNIVAYLKENKTEGIIKKHLYDLTPYGHYGRQAIRNYEYSQNQWQLKSEEKL